MGVGTQEEPAPPEGVQARVLCLTPVGSVGQSRRRLVDRSGPFIIDSTSGFVCVAGLLADETDRGGRRASPAVTASEAVREESERGLRREAMDERRVVWFSGWVQGVGFRFTTVSVARRHAVSGYVQNLPDGRVVVEAEGVPQELDRFFADLRYKMQDYIRGVKEQKGPATGEFTGFTIRY